MLLIYVGLGTLLFGLIVCILDIRAIILNLAGRERSVSLELFLSIIFVAWYCIYMIISAMAT